jgi:hypothetical protein
MLFLRKKAIILFFFLHIFEKFYICLFKIKKPTLIQPKNPIPYGDKCKKKQVLPLKGSF